MLPPAEVEMQESQNGLVKEKKPLKIGKKEKKKIRKLLYDAFQEDCARYEILVEDNESEDTIPEQWSWIEVCLTKELIEDYNLKYCEPGMKVRGQVVDIKIWKDSIEIE